jgi:hypothetical protein
MEKFPCLLPNLQVHYFVGKKTPRGHTLSYFNPQSTLDHAKEMAAFKAVRGSLLHLVVLKARYCLISNRQARRLYLVSCPQLIIENICTYHHYVVGIPFHHNLRACHGMGVFRIACGCLMTCIQHVYLMDILQ